MASLRSADQERAQYAWEKVCAVGRPEEYARLAKSAPSLVMTNGLMQTLAYLQAKGHLELLKHLQDWLQKRLFPSAKSFDGLMKCLYESPSDTFMRATREALELLRWLRQFADARRKAL